MEIIFIGKVPSAENYKHLEIVNEQPYLKNDYLVVLATMMGNERYLYICVCVCVCITLMKISAKFYYDN